MRFEPGWTYRMPVAFGPMPGPRQTLPGEPPRGTEACVTTWTLGFPTTADAVAALLPPCFAPAGEPVVTVEYTELSDVGWLAGRGYHTFAVKLPARFDGRRDRVRGSFVAVVWEGMADPIITGREELGYAKLYADLASVPDGPGAHRCTASWDGHLFAELELDVTEGTPPDGPPGDGTLNYRYLPAVDPGAEPDSDGPVLTPAVPATETVAEATATGRVRFVRSSWEQLPTFHHVVDALADLELGPGTGAVRTVRRDIANRGQRHLV